MTRQNKIQPCVSILIPHYKTLELTKLCLRSIKKYTDLKKAHVIVIDNDSGDESTVYLRTLKWITLIERDVILNESPPLAHARALDLGMESVETKYVLSIHTDTIVYHNKWLDFLLEELEKDENIAGVGSWKLEQKPAVKLLVKKIEKLWQTKIWYPLCGKGEGAIEGIGKNYYYLRSHCALYKTDLLRQYSCTFNDGSEPTGKVLHNKLKERGHVMVFLQSEDLLPYVKHLNHATMILNPEISGRKTGSKKEFRRISKELERLDYKAILKDSAIDQDAVE